MIERETDRRDRASQEADAARHLERASRFPESTGADAARWMELTAAWEILQEVERRRAMGG